MSSVLLHFRAGRILRMFISREKNPKVHIPSLAFRAFPNYLNLTSLPLFSPKIGTDHVGLAGLNLQPG